MNFWKNWPYWVKGGVIGVLLYGFATIILIPFGAPPFQGIMSFPYWIIPTMITLWATYPFGGLVAEFNQTGIFIFIGAIIVYFLIGAIAGLIYGKIKNRKQVV